MAKAARRTFMTLVGIVLLLVSIMILLESRWAREWLEGQVSQRLNGRDVEIGSLDIGWGWPLTIRLEDVSVANPDWAPHEQMLDLTALEIAVDPGALLQGKVRLERLHLERPEVHLARREDGTTSWGGLTDQQNGGGGGPGISPDTITIDEGRLTYRDPALEANLSVTFHTEGQQAGERQLVAEAQGTFRNMPLELSGQGGAPAQALAEQSEGYPVRLEGHLGQLQASFSGQLQKVMQVGGLQGTLNVSAPEEANVAKLLGRPSLSLPAMQIQGQLSYQGQRWALQNFNARLGESQLTGSVGVTLGGRPQIEAQISADQLSLAQWGMIGPSEKESRADGAGKDVAWDRNLANQLALLRGFDARVDLSVGRLSYGDTVLRDVALEGSLEEGRLNVQRLHAAQGQGELTAQGWLNVQPNTLSADIDARLSQIDLGDTLAPLGYGELGTLGGRLHARLTDGQLTLDDTSIDYRAPQQALSLLHLNVDTADISNTSAPGVHLQGSGAYHGESFEYDLRVGPLLNLRSPDKPYPVQGRIASGESTLHVDGTIQQPLELGRVQGTFRLAGPNPARLNDLTGLSLPALPPYELQGELQIQDDLVRLVNLDGTFGNSDVSGDARLQLGERPMLWATLHSQRLDLDDFAPLTGAAPETEDGEAASPAQQELARQEEQRAGIFPDREWDLEGLRSMDAHVRYSAASVSAKDIPLSNVSLDLTMDEGVLTLRPLRMEIGDGRVVAQLRMDARGAVLNGSLDLSIRQVNLKALLQRADLSDIAEDSAGIIGGEGQVSFKGNSMDAVMASLDGDLELAMSGGRLDMLLVEGLGLDVSEALLAALAETDTVPMQCAYAQLQAKEGMASLDPFFISTNDSNITGGGTVNLDTERLNLIFEAHPKDPSLPASNSPVRLQGAIQEPQVDVVSRELLTRGALSALGALVAPPLAILPWIEPGMGEGSGPGCRQVLDKFHSQEQDVGI